MHCSSEHWRETLFLSTWHRVSSDHHFPFVLQAKFAWTEHKISRQPVGNRSSEWSSSTLPGVCWSENCIPQRLSWIRRWSVYSCPGYSRNRWHCPTKGANRHGHLGSCIWPAPWNKWFSLSSRSIWLQSCDPDHRTQTPAESKPQHRNR